MGRCSSAVDPVEQTVVPPRFKAQHAYVDTSAMNLFVSLSAVRRMSAYRPNCPLRPRQTMRMETGFTLIEVMIVVSIVAILAAVATPMYSDQMRRGHRASAEAVLLDAAVRQRQFLIDQRSFATSTSELGLTVPASLTGRYTVTITAPTGAVPPTFVVMATPSGAQAADRCGTLSVDHAGTRLPSGCW